MTQVFIDLDGVMADFDRHYETTFGVRPSKEADDVDWAKVRSIPGFYRNIPLMPDALELWDFVRRLKKKPIILTGCPKLVPEAADEKRAFVADRIGSNVDVICCRSRDKSLVLKDEPGGILIDDWERYRDLWVAKGGRWITHTSAENSIQQLLEMGIGL